MPALQQASDVGQVEFVCADDGVQIEVSGARYPCNTQVPLTPGSRAYTAHYPVGSPHTGMVRVGAGERVREEIPSSGVAPGFGTLEVTCTPQGAKVVLVAKQEKRRRSLTCPGKQAVEAGTYMLSAKLSGRQPYEQEVEVPEGASVAVAVTFPEPQDAWFELQAGVGYGWASKYGDGAEGELGALLTSIEAVYFAARTSYFFGGGVQASIGEALGMLPYLRIGARWAQNTTSVFYGIGFGYGTLGIPACAPGSCANEGEEPGLVYLLGGGLHVGLTERFALLTQLDFASNLSTKASLRIAGGIMARF
jgi:hypothetical protein